jgi:hypothetical protein
MDPRVKTPEAGLRQQYTLSRSLDGAIRRGAAALQQSRAQGDAGQKLTQELQRQIGALGQLFGLIEGADVTPTTQAAAAVQEINAGMQEMSASAGELARIARELQDETGRFRTGAGDDAPEPPAPDAPPVAVPPAHRAFATAA